MDWQNIFLTYDGRLNRKPFWIANLIMFVVNLVGTGIGEVIGGAFGNLIQIIVVLATLVPSIFVAIKRYHDRDKSGWWLCINFIPLIGFIWYIVEVGFLRGTQGANKYGPDPLAG